MIAAVITGDVINSTANTAFLEKLQLVLKDISCRFQINEKNAEIYRGDSFQLVLEDPQEALLLAMLIRAGLRSATYYEDFPQPFDAKIAIGIGEVTSQGKKPGESSGDAFLYSGRKLDELQGKKYNMALKLDNEIFDHLADTVVRFIDDIIVNWSSISADTACYSWFRNLNQEQLAEELGISQPAVNKRLQAARMHLLEHADTNFRIFIKSILHDRTSDTV